MMIKTADHEYCECMPLCVCVCKCAHKYVGDCFMLGPAVVNMRTSVIESSDWELVVLKMSRQQDYLEAC
jgi:hypothetical protein